MECYNIKLGKTKFKINKIVLNKYITHQVLGQTYDAITRLLQGFVQNEEALHDDKSCWKTCESFTKVTFRSYKGTKCDRKGCKGEIYDCKFVSDVLKICPSVRIQKN